MVGEPVTPLENRTFYEFPVTVPTVVLESAIYEEFVVTEVLTGEPFTPLV